MSEAFTTDPSAMGRRRFLKRAVAAAAALSAASLLFRRPWSRRSSSRSIPADVPGAGSIFQPRGDTRQQ